LRIASNNRVHNGDGYSACICANRQVFVQHLPFSLTIQQVAKLGMWKAVVGGHMFLQWKLAGIDKRSEPVSALILKPGQDSHLLDAAGIGCLSTECWKSMGKNSGDVPVVWAEHN
jgi:hypothetical protein